MKRSLWFLVLWLAGCTVTPPPGITSVTGFDLNRYLGQSPFRSDSVFSARPPRHTAHQSLSTSQALTIAASEPRAFP